MVQREEVSISFDRFLGRKIRENRRALGYTVTHVLDELGKKGVFMNERSYYRIEAGLRTVYPLELVFLAKILNIDLAAFATHAPAFTSLSFSS